MEFAVTLGIGGWAVLIVGALVLGIAGQLTGEATSGYEWFATAVGAGLGALVASEFIIGWQAFEPVFDGLALIPALIGGAGIGLIVAVGSRLITGGTYTRPYTT